MCSQPGQSCTAEGPVGRAAWATAHCMCQQSPTQTWSVLWSAVLCCAVQLKTRAFGFPTANVLIPLVDMGNHHNECRHSLMVESCDPIEGQQQWQERKHPPLTTATGSGVYHPAASSSSSGLSGQCMVWRAEAPVAVGQVVCNNYGAGLQDRMLLQYGFLQVCSFLCDRCGSWGRGACLLLLYVCHCHWWTQLKSSLWAYSPRHSTHHRHTVVFPRLPFPVCQYSLLCDHLITFVFYNSSTQQVALAHMTCPSDTGQAPCITTATVRSVRCVLLLADWACH